MCTVHRSYFLRFESPSSQVAEQATTKPPEQQNNNNTPQPQNTQPNRTRRQRASEFHFCTSMRHGENEQWLLSTWAVNSVSCTFVGQSTKRHRAKRPVPTGQCTSTCRCECSSASSQLICAAQSPNCKLPTELCEPRAQWSADNDAMAVENSSYLASVVPSNSERKR